MELITVLQAVVLKKVSASKLNKVDDVSVISKSDIIIKGNKVSIAETLTGLGVSGLVSMLLTQVQIDELLDAGIIRGVK